MINKLSITNYAIISHLEVDFFEGFTVITGETGAGKSIILGALNLLLGNRFDAVNFKEKSVKSIIEGHFNISKLKLKTFFLNNDIDYDDNLIIRREFLYAGKSRSFVNDSPVKLDLLKLLGTYLVDIHSQHDNLYINNENFQIDLLDKTAESLFPDFIKNKITYQETFKKLNNLDLDLESKKRLRNYHPLDFEYKQNFIHQMEILNLQLGEKEKLELEFEKIDNIHSIKEVLSDVILLMESKDSSIISSINAILTKLESVKKYDSKISILLSRIKENLIDFNDILMDFHSINHDFNIDSNRLEFLQDRINTINSFESKLNASGEEDLLNKLKLMKEEIISLKNIDNEIEILEKEREKIKQFLFEIAKNLSFYRKKSSVKLISQLKLDLIELGIKTPFIDFQFKSHKEFSPNGTDSVDLLFSSNRGYELKPLNNIGSGGEIARIMLCVKKYLFFINQFSSIIFDEIDSGVSGKIGRKMGNILKEISKKGQVICITHLPQIASLGTYHYHVSKKNNNNSTTTLIKKLSNDNRLKELARMLSGDEVNDEAIANAKKMLDI
ncbi:MAG: hypothetical protein CMP49_06280 [Flavobacteriales bacterium]|nr:hypothetical protein [Flavobacteriales bacterium]|tara:strand:- start:1309 stop:2979 length:1671 start_codon:yes stop_codon:yes gene_type:complete